MSEKYFRENEWWVSPYNFIPEVRNTYQLPKSVSIHDATLRDGEQTPGVVMSIAEKVAIAEKLDEIGVDRIEAGMPAVSDQDFQAIQQISKLGLKSKIYTFARAINADIDKALECDCHGVIVDRVPFAANKPIPGDRNFTRESGIGVDLVVKEPLAKFGTHPSLTSRRGEVVLGKKSGKLSITYNLEKMVSPMPMTKRSAKC